MHTSSFERWYLGYLALLPAVGAVTLFSVITLPEWSRFIGFMLGAAGVAIYLATTTSYTVVPISKLQRATLVLSGPLWALVSVFLFHGTLPDFIISTALIQIGVACGSVLLTVVTHAPTKNDKLKGLVATLLPLFGTLLLAALYVSSLWQAVVLLGAVLQGSVLQKITVTKDVVLRQSPKIILFGLLTWVAAYIFGNAYFGG